ncbi:MAG TPA: DUF2851 family protein [Balneolales bacterium]|nr:DUF2851 family protein [Balneolales bacterium]
MNERLFQYIWSNLYFDFRRLISLHGKNITIIHQGKLNQGDGPDFHDAVIKVDGLLFHGAVELHLNAKDWFQHNHQNDERYNNVILHVVLFDKDLCDVTRYDGTQPFTLLLKPYISSKIHSIFKRQNKFHGLACSGFLKEIPVNIIQEQWQDSRSEYFEYKVDQLSPHFKQMETNFPAWKTALTFGLFDGLGISDNREAMKHLCSLFFKKKEGGNQKAPVIKQMLWELSGLSNHSDRAEMSRTEWSFSGTRPKNQPDIRIPQAANLLSNLIEIPSPFSMDQIDDVWIHLMKIRNGICEPIGKNRQDVLFATVFLPSLYLLGIQQNHSELQKEAFNLWQNYQIPVPRKISQKFKATGLESKYFRHHLGVIFQFKHYCKNGECQDCKIMKYALKT